MIDTREQPPPSPASTLRGMERPIRTFSSFVKTAPPPSSSHNHKPLLPTPVFGRTVFDVSPTPPPLPSDQPTIDTSWKAPTAWDDSNTPYKGLQAPVLFNNRSYVPLLSEGSPGAFDKLEPFPQSSGMTTPPSSGFNRIGDRIHRIHALPPRSPFRISTFQTPATESDPGAPTLSLDFYSAPSPRVGTPSSFLIPGGSHERAESTSWSDKDVRISNLSTKAKVFASIGPESSEDRDRQWDNWSDGPGTSQLREGSRSPLATHGHKLVPSVRGTLSPNDAPAADEVSERFRNLSVSQECHSILADQYHEDREHSSTRLAQDQSNSSHPVPTPTAVTSRTPTNKGDLIPRPLSRKKEHSNFTSQDFTGNGRPDSTTKQRRKSSWVPLHQISHFLRRPSLDEIHAHSNIDPVLTSPGQGMEGRRQTSKKERRVSDLILNNPRNFGYNTKRGRSPEAYRSTGSQQSAAVSTRHPLDSPKSLVRPHSGFSATDSSSISSPRQQTTSFLDVSPASTLETPRAFPNTTSPSDFDPPSNDWGRSFVYSQYTHASVAPDIAIRPGMRSSSDSMPSFRTHSNPSSPTSPLAHQISCLRTPPPIPAYAPRIVASPTDYSPASYRSAQSWFSRAESGSDEEFPKRSVPMGLLDKAKGACNAWRRRQRDVKNNKLKASIRVVGPMEPTVDSVRDMRHDRALVDAGEQNMAPGYMAASAF